MIVRDPSNHSACQWHNFNDPSVTLKRPNNCQSNNFSEIYHIFQVRNLQFVRYSEKCIFSSSSFYPVNLKSSVNNVDNDSSCLLNHDRPMVSVFLERDKDVARVKKERRSRIQMLLHASTSDLPRERPMGFLCRPSSPYQIVFLVGAAFPGGK